MTNANINFNWGWENDIWRYGDPGLYGVDIDNLKTKVVRVRFNCDLIDTTEDVFELTAHSITAIQNIHFQADAIGKFLTHYLIGTQLGNRRRFYLGNVLEYLKCNSADYSVDETVLNTDPQKRHFTDLVNSWIDFQNSKHWILINFITNEEKHNRSFEGEFDKGSFQIPVRYDENGIKRTIEDEEMKEIIEEFEELGIYINDKSKFERDAREVLEGLHLINKSTIEEWQGLMIQTIDKTMDMLINYKELLEPSQN